MLGGLGKKIMNAVLGASSAMVIDENVINDALKEVCSALLEADVQVKVVFELRARVKAKLVGLAPGIDLRKQLRLGIVEELTRMVGVSHRYVPIPSPPSSEEEGVLPNTPPIPAIIMMLGLQGAGKTTTTVKLAIEYSKREYTVGVVCADTFRAGAYDQLEMLCTKVPSIKFYGSRTEASPVAVAVEGIRHLASHGCDLVIVDTSGRHSQSTDLLDEMREIYDAINPQHTYFVLDATNGQSIAGHVLAFTRVVPVGQIILTKIDGGARGGGALSAVATSGSSVGWVCNGEKLTDIDEFNPRGFISRLLGMGDLEGLFNKLDTTNFITDDEAAEQIARGRITPLEFQRYVEMMEGMGEMLKYMPEMEEVLIPSEESIREAIKKYRAVLDSCTMAELEERDRMTPSRHQRIARGSGVPIEFVQKTFAVIGQMSGMMGTISKMNAPGMLPLDKMVAALQMSIRGQSVKTKYKKMKIRG